MQFALISSVTGCYILLHFSKGQLTAKYLKSIDVSANYLLNILRDLQMIFLCFQVTASCAFPSKGNYKTKIHVWSLESEPQKIQFKEM